MWKYKTVFTTHYQKWFMLKIFNISYSVESVDKIVKIGQISETDIISIIVVKIVVIEEALGEIEHG